MAIVNARNLVDSATRTVRMFEINNDTNSAVVCVDASALRGHSSNPTLHIKSIKWNTTAVNSNVKFLFDQGSYSDSYYLGHKAKALCTWSSTLAYEFLGDGRVSYFIDPQNKNISFI